MQFFKSFIFIMGITQAAGLIGYDCKSSNAKIMSVSTLEVEKCQDPEIETKEVKNIEITIIHRKKYHHVDIARCSLQIQSYTFYCGMSSHVSLLENSFQQFNYKFSAAECEDLIKTNQIKYPYNTNIIVRGEKGKMIQQNLKVFGSVDQKGNCEGQTVSINGKLVRNTIVQHNIRLYYDETGAKLELSTGVLHMNDGITCEYAAGRCTDFHLGSFFWTPKDNVKCNIDQFQLLYRGPAKKTTLSQKESGIKQSIITVREDPYIFALKESGPIAICREHFLMTDQEEIFIVPYNHDNGILRQEMESLETENLSLLAYINTKFLFMEMHQAEQVERVYKSLLRQECEDRKRIMENLLSIAHIAPDEFAFQLMGKEGYAALPRGEQVIIIQCKPMNVTYRENGKCYLEIPITYQEQDLFLTPRNRLITDHANEIQCNELYATAYKLNQDWTSISTPPSAIRNPQRLNPNTNKTWEFEYIDSIGASGLYNQDQLERLAKKMALPAERQAIANSIINSFGNNQNLKDNSISLSLEDRIIKKAKEAYYSLVWGKLASFGTLCSGFIGIYIILKVIWSAISTIGNGYQLYQLFGWSTKLLAAICQSLTMLLINQKNRKRESNQYEKPPLPPKPKEEEQPSSSRNTAVKNIKETTA